MHCTLLILPSKYQFMEVNTQRRAAGLKDKIPDIQKTLDTVRFLKTRKVSRDPIYLSVVKLSSQSARLRSNRNDIRVERYTIRQSTYSANGRGLPMAWGMYHL